MRSSPLRPLGSAVLAAAIVAADLVLLTLFLNPEASLRRDAPALALALGLPYTAAATLAFVLAALVARALRGGAPARRPLLAGVPWFASFAFLALATAALLFWLNALSYSHSIPEASLRALLAAAVWLSFALLVLIALGLDAWLYPERGRGISAALVVLAAASAVVAPLALRPAPPRPAQPVPLATETVRPLRRVVLVGMDGLGAEALAQGVAAGRLPAFADLLARGAHGPLATLRPTEGPPIWTTVVTGRLPRDHGVKSFATYRLRGSSTVYELLPKGAFVRLLERASLVTTAPVTSASRRRRALWNALNAFGIETGVVRLWGSYPPERVQGFMLSNYFHLLRGSGPPVSGPLHPPDLLQEVRARAVEPEHVDSRLASEFVDLSVSLPADPVPWRRELVEKALAPDLTYQRAGAVLRAVYDPPFFATYFYGLDPVGHAFLRYARPERFGDVRPEELRRYGHVYDRYADYLGEGVAETARALRPGEVLLVVSGYGMEPVPLWRRLLAGIAGGSSTSGTHAGAPDGFILALGDGVRAGASIRAASVLDVAPTVLYLMGLPVGRDMEGRVLTEMLDDAFTQARPVTFIPSYESLAVTPVTGEAGPDLPLLPDEEP
jgi:predicted AlkP superfamily phosphohydrolase/phosphomutase